MYFKLTSNSDLRTKCISNSLTCPLYLEFTNVFTAFQFTYEFNVTRIYLLIQWTTYLKFSSLSNVSQNNVRTQHISIFYTFEPNMPNNIFTS